MDLTTLRRFGRTLGTLAAALLLSVGPSVAPSQAASEFERDPEIRDGKVRGSVVVGHSVGTLSKNLLAAPRLYVDFRPLEALKIWLDVPTSHVSIAYDADGGASSFQIANVSFGARFVTRLSDELVLKIGGGLAVPSASVPDATPDRFRAQLAHLATSMAHGLWQMWLYSPNRLTIVSDNKLVFRAGVFRLVANADVALMIGTGDASEADLEVVAQFAASAGYQGKAIGAGVSVRGVWMATQDGDNFQVSAAPFFRAFLSGGFFDFRFNININKPAGFSFDDNRWWGIEIGLGAFL